MRALAIATALALALAAQGCGHNAADLGPSTGRECPPYRTMTPTPTPVTTP